MKTLIIIILILLVVGMYYVPDITKSIIKVTGSAAANVGKQGIEKIKDSDSFDNATKAIKDKIIFVVDESKN